MWKAARFVLLITMGSQLTGLFLVWGLALPAMFARPRHWPGQALLNENQQLLNVLNQVRTDYLNVNLAERQIDVASIGVVSSTEQLRLSEVRLANGVGTNIDVVTAQQAWEQALVNKAQAMIQFNQAQVQLVHDLGIPTVANLLGGRLIGLQQ